MKPSLANLLLGLLFVVGIVAALFFGGTSRNGDVLSSLRASTGSVRGRDTGKTRDEKESFDSPAVEDSAKKNTPENIPVNSPAGIHSPDSIEAETQEDGGDVSSPARNDQSFHPAVSLSERGVEEDSGTSFNPYSSEKLEEHVKSISRDTSSQGIARHRAESAQKYLQSVKQLGSTPPAETKTSVVANPEDNPYQLLALSLPQNPDAQADFVAQLQELKSRNLLEYLSAVQALGSGQEAQSY